MNFTEEEIKELREIYKKEFGEDDISDEQLVENATQVINLLEAVYKPK